MSVHLASYCESPVRTFETARLRSKSEAQGGPFACIKVGLQLLNFAIAVQSIV